jgi:hypothetical protein
VLTIISLPCNAGIAVQTTNVTLDDTPSPERLKRELRSGSAGREFQPMLHASLAASVDVLSSVIAFINVGSIIGKKRDDVKGESLENRAKMLYLI